MKIFKKIKYITIGLILGIIITSTFPVMATTVKEFILKQATVKLILDNQEIKNDTLPVLYYNGYNYIPAATFRDITKKLGIGFEYVQSTNEIRIDTTLKKGDNLENKENNLSLDNEFNQEEYKEFKNLFEFMGSGKQLDYTYYIDYGYKVKSDYSIDEIIIIVKKYKNYENYFKQMALEAREIILKNEGIEKINNRNTSINDLVFINKKIGENESYRDGTFIATCKIDFSDKSENLVNMNYYNYRFEK